VILEKFGDVYASATALGAVQAKEDTSPKREVVAVSVSGAGGAFDVWGDDNGPHGAVVVTKEVTVTGTSYSNAETNFNTLKAATIAGLSKLWALMRDGTTVRWAWAKCIGLDRKEEAGGPAVAIPTKLSFWLPEGLWYASSMSSANRTGAGSLSCTNSGDYRALVRAVVAAGATNPGISIGAGPPVWAYTGVSAGAGVVVDGWTRRVTNAGADAYANLSYGVAGVGQVEFFWLPPGANTVTVTMAGSVGITLYWYNTYL
jgi:hypothetical protein